MFIPYGSAGIYLLMYLWYVWVWRLI